MHKMFIDCNGVNHLFVFDCVVCEIFSRTRAPMCKDGLWCTVLSVFGAAVLLFGNVFACNQHKYDNIVFWHLLKIMVGPPLASPVGTPHAFGTAILGGLKKTVMWVLLRPLR